MKGVEEGFQGQSDVPVLCVVVVQDDVCMCWCACGISSKGLICLVKVRCGYNIGNIWGLMCSVEVR